MPMHTHARTDGHLASSANCPAAADPVYPVQILSSINASLICLFLWAYYPLRRHDGEVFALLITIYPVTRILDGNDPQRRIEHPVGQFPVDDFPDGQRPVAGLRRGLVVFHPDAAQRAVLLPPARRK